MKVIQLFLSGHPDNHAFGGTEICVFVYFSSFSETLLECLPVEDCNLALAQIGSNFKQLLGREAPTARIFQDIKIPLQLHQFLSNPTFMLCF